MLEKIFSLKKNSTINLIPVDIGGIVIKIPVADISGGADGPTVVITAGMDGDEYAGIEAAYRIIDEMSVREFAGRLIVIPIVNIPGFEAECSYCPVDGQFPKNFFPGDSNGSATERIVSWLVQNYLSEAKLWIDLHSGAITEGLNPFIYLYETDSRSVDALTQKLMAASISQTVLLQTASWGSKPALLAKMGCAYVLAESGARGSYGESDVTRHTTLIKESLGVAGMIPEHKQERSVRVLREIVYISAPRNGLWRAKPVGVALNKGDEIGEWSDIDGGRKKIIVAPISGMPLWWKETLFMRESEVLCAIAR